MKKILTVLFCTLLLITALVPVSASASSGSALGTWTVSNWNNENSRAYGRFNVLCSFDVDGDGSAVTFNQINIGYSYGGDSWYSFPGCVVLYNSPTDYLELPYSDFETFTLNIYSGDDVENTDLINWLNQYGTQSFCDGSSCSSTVIDNGTACPDCGRVVRVLNYVPQPNNWNSEYPWLQTTNQAYYFIYQVTDGTTYLVEYPTSVRPAYDSTQKNGVLTISEIYSYYRLDNGSWVYASDVSPHVVGGYNLGAWTPLFSQVQINDETGNPFFPLPLHKEILEVVKGEVPNLNQSLDGNLMILTLCGVGCLTLLMASPILSKTLRIFLRR